jgi:hypothetical protein
MIIEKLPPRVSVLPESADTGIPAIRMHAMMTETVTMLRCFILQLHGTENNVLKCAWNVHG